MFWRKRHATIASAAAAVRPAPGAVMTKRPTNASPPGCATSGVSSAAANEIVPVLVARRRRNAAFGLLSPSIPPSHPRASVTFSATLSRDASRVRRASSRSSHRTISAARSARRDASVQPCTNTPRDANARNARVLNPGSSLRSPLSTTCAPVRSTTSRRLCTRLASRTYGCLLDYRWPQGGSVRVRTPRVSIEGENASALRPGRLETNRRFASRAPDRGGADKTKPTHRREDARGARRGSS